MGGAKMRIKAFLCLLGLSLTATLAAPMPSNKLETNRGLVKHCQAGKMHTLRYETVGVSSEKIVDLDGTLGAKVKGVTCDMDGTRLDLNFKHRADAMEWWFHFQGYLIGEDHFIVGGAKWNCTMKDKRSAMLRRVISASEPHVGHTITVKTSLARYDDLYETAEIAYSTADASPSECEAVPKVWTRRSASATTATVVARPRHRSRSTPINGSPQPAAIATPPSRPTYSSISRSGTGSSRASRAASKT